jgi:hypothetical protein
LFVEVNIGAAIQEFCPEVLVMTFGVCLMSKYLDIYTVHGVCVYAYILTVLFVTYFQCEYQKPQTQYSKFFCLNVLYEA